MDTYRVQVTRTGYASAQFKVAARSRNEACRLALEKAGDHSFSERDADYDIENVELSDE